VKIERIYLGLDTRMDAFMIGAAVALAMQVYGVPATTRVRQVAEVGAVAALAGLGYMVMSQSVVETFWYSNGGFTAVALCSAVLVVRAAVGGRGPVLALLELKPLVALGRISYSVYLWHWPFFILTETERTGWSLPPTLAVRLVGTLAVSMLSFRYLEKPFLHARRPAPTSQLAPAVA
jgi:peptidoglycan/LPS O-acetylase OafA/YrhL